MKTNREWLNTFKPFYRRKLIDRAKAFWEGKYKKWLTIKVNSVEMFIYGAFYWSGSIDGLDYWADFMNNIDKYLLHQNYTENERIYFLSGFLSPSISRKEKANYSKS